MAVFNPFEKFATLRVGACATSSHERVFIIFGGPVFRDPWGMIER
jgi:hypothetical protein